MADQEKTFEKIEKDGETILTSRGYENEIDVDSLLENNNDEKQTEEQKLSVNVDLELFYEQKKREIFHGKLITLIEQHEKGNTLVQQIITISIMMPVENALYISEICKEIAYVGCLFNMSYVYHEKSIRLKVTENKRKHSQIRQTILGVEITSIKNSCCVLTVKMSNHL